MHRIAGICGQIVGMNHEIFGGLNPFHAAKQGFNHPGFRLGFILQEDLELIACGHTVHGLFIICRHRLILVQKTNFVAGHNDLNGGGTATRTCKRYGDRITFHGAGHGCGHICRMGINDNSLGRADRHFGEAIPAGQHLPLDLLPFVSRIAGGLIAESKGNTLVQRDRIGLGGRLLLRGTEGEYFAI